MRNLKNILVMSTLAIIIIVEITILVLLFPFAFGFKKTESDALKEQLMKSTYRKIDFQKSAFYTKFNNAKEHDSIFYYFNKMIQDSSIRGNLKR